MCSAQQLLLNQFHCFHRFSQHNSQETSQCCHGRCHTANQAPSQWPRPPEENRSTPSVRVVMCLYSTSMQSIWESGILYLYETICFQRQFIRVASAEGIKRSVGAQCALIALNIRTTRLYTCTCQTQISDGLSTACISPWTHTHRHKLTCTV